MGVLRIVINDTFGIVKCEGTHQDIADKVYEVNGANFVTDEAKEVLTKNGFKYVQNGRDNGDVREEFWVKD